MGIRSCLVVLGLLNPLHSCILPWQPCTINPSPPPLTFWLWADRGGIFPQQEIY